MIAKGCKDLYKTYFSMKKRHDEDVLAGVPYSLCCSQVILARPLEHKQPGALNVGVSQWNLWENEWVCVKLTYLEIL